VGSGGLGWVWWVTESVRVEWRECAKGREEAIFTTKPPSVTPQAISTTIPRLCSLKPSLLLYMSVTQRASVSSALRHVKRKLS